MSEVIGPLMRALDQGAQNARTALPSIQAEMRLTQDEMDDLIPSGGRTRVFDRADWALFHLMRSGYVERPKRGVYRLTEEGRARLGREPDPDLAELRGKPAYVAWRSKRKDGSELSTADSIQEVEVDHQGETAPDELIAAAHAELTDALAADLLDLCLSLTPARFEQLIVDLLIAMGYGGGDERMGRQLGRSGDGGIDGVIDEDALGLDAVYVQAKRYAPENTVGRPAIQQFIGSLTGEGATKGVFVTTSSFSREARDYAGRVMQRVVLIDGTRLARLMVRHGVGVRVRQTYEVKSVDEDYFADPL